MWRIVTGLFLVVILMMPSWTRAAMSDWKDLGGGKARLVAVKDPETNAIEAIVEVRLEPGWKTYWRAPGDSGIPPEFDFSRSTNFSPGPVRFPVPVRISLPETDFFGYKDKVSFILGGNAEAVDTTLAIDLLIGVCEEICIPATASFTIAADELNRSDPKAEIAIMLARAGLPASPSDGMRVVEVVLAGQTLHARLEGNRLTGKEYVAIGLPNNWISDPLPVAKNAQGHWQVSTKLPSSFTEMNTDNAEWHYTILQTSGTDGNVLLAAEGKITVPGN